MPWNRTNFEDSILLAFLAEIALSSPEGELFHLIYFSRWNMCFSNVFTSSSIHSWNHSQVINEYVYHLIGRWYYDCCHRFGYDDSTQFLEQYFLQMHFKNTRMKQHSASISKTENWYVFTLRKTNHVHISINIKQFMRKNMPHIQREISDDSRNVQFSSYFIH